MNIISHEFDPDFDKTHSGEHQVRLSFFDALSLVKPEVAFWSGIVTALFAIGTVGFVVLMVMRFKGL